MTRRRIIWPVLILLVGGMVLWSARGGAEALTAEEAMTTVRLWLDAPMTDVPTASPVLDRTLREQFDPFRRADRQSVSLMAQSGAAPGELDVRMMHTESGEELTLTLVRGTAGSVLVTGFRTEE